MHKKELAQLVSPGTVIIKKAKKKRASNVLYYISGTILSLFFLFPIFYMVATSTKTEEIYARNAGTFMMFIPDFSNIGTWFSNYSVIFGEYNIWQYALNSLIYAAIVIVLNILVNGLAAYALSKLKFPGSKFFMFIILFLIVVPVETSIIPLYAICKTMLGLKSTLSVMAIIMPASISVFNIFLFIQFFTSIPKEYQEAARIDGANTLTIFFKIILPLSKPIIATVAVFCFIGVWNDYLWPAMVLPYAGEGEYSLLPIQAALTTIQSIEGITTGQIMASLVVTSLPIFIVYVVAQKYIVKGFGSAGLKI